MDDVDINVTTHTAVEQVMGRHLSYISHFISKNKEQNPIKVVLSLTLQMRNCVHAFPTYYNSHIG